MAPNTPEQSWPKELSSQGTSIEGLLSFNLPVHGDQRGWFKENYQKEKLTEHGLPKEFQVVQNNISFNQHKGVTRGIHGEPWNKFISVAHGEVFAAIVDLRAGSSFGKVETFHLDPGKAIYVPAGCGNSFQTLTNDVVYTYLVDAYWSADAEYTMLNLADDTVAIDWPIPLEEAIISDKDREHPYLKDVTPVSGRG